MRSDDVAPQDRTASAVQATIERNAIEAVELGIERSPLSGREVSGLAGVRAARYAMPASSPVVVLACTACELAYTPDGADFSNGKTGCPRCGGWTWIARLEPADGDAVGGRL